MSSEKEILDLEDKRYAAMCGGDFAALERMLHDELLYTHSSGFTDTKANVACFPPVGKDEVQERGLQRSQGAPCGRHGARHRSRKVCDPCRTISRPNGEMLLACERR